MVHDDRFPIAAQLFIRLKRSPGRVIDVTWMLQNEPYAQEVLKVARTADAESADLASRFEALTTSLRNPVPTPAAFSRAGRAGGGQQPLRRQLALRSRPRKSPARGGARGGDNALLNLRDQSLIASTWIASLATVGPYLAP